MKIFSPSAVPCLISQNDLYSEENKSSFFEMLEYLKDAASRGDANAQWRLGMFYLLGVGSCEKSEEKAANWLILAAKKGVAQALFNLGVLYEYGRGVRRSLGYANHLYRIAEGLGIAEAKTRLSGTRP